MLMSGALGQLGQSVQLCLVRPVLDLRLSPHPQHGSIWSTVVVRTNEPQTSSLCVPMRSGTDIA